MDNLNDAYLDVLSNYSGSADDRRKAYLMDYLNYVNTTSLNDLEWAVLQKLGYKNSLTDAWLDHLKGLGGMTLSDKGSLLSSTFYGSSPSRLFLNNEVGVYYDLSDLTTLFQDSAGTTPVTAAGQPVGLMLDKSKSLALGSELVVNGDLSAGVTGWTAGASSSISVSGGGLVITEDGSDGTSARAYQIVTTVVGRAYNISIDVTAAVGRGQLAVHPSAANIGGAILALSPLGNGSVRNVTAKFIATSTTSHIILDSAVTTAGTVTFDNISVKEIAGNHATQATSAQRPTYGIHPYSGVRNRANGSADVGNNAVWLVSQTQSGVTMTKTASGFDTDGLPYVDVRYVGTSTGTNHDQAYAFNSAVFAGTSGQQATTSVVARVIAGSISNVNGLQARTSEETAPSTFIGIAVGNLVTASVDTISTATRTLATGNQFRATLSLTFNTASAIDVTYRIKGLQLELGSTRTAYQANYSQYNITEAGVSSVHYLGFDGVDDGMVTSAINFSATNKMTVFVGLRKLSDATQGVVAELTQFVGSFAGSFTVFAPATGTAANYGWRCRGNGTVPIVNSPTTFAAPDTAVFTGIGNISGDIATLRIDGVQVSTDTTTDQGTGNFANDIFYIGRRGGSSLPFNGNIYSLIVRGAESNTSQITNVENWINAQTGAY